MKHKLDNDGLEVTKHHWRMLIENPPVAYNTPEQLWERIVSYFKWCDENPIFSKRSVLTGRNAGDKFNDESPRPYSIKAMCLHCGITEKYLKDISKNENDTSGYYNVVYSAISVIYLQNYEYTVVGVYPSSFMSKVLGLGTDEKMNQPIKIEIAHGLPQLESSESEILKKLDLEMASFQS